MLTNKISPELFKFILNDTPEDRNHYRSPVTGVIHSTPKTPDYDRVMDHSNIQNIHINKDYLDY